MTMGSTASHRKTEPRTHRPSVQAVVGPASTRIGRLTTVEKQNGVVYTPGILADYLADKLIGYYCASLDEPCGQGGASDSDAISKLADIRIMDPACGDGGLLVAAWHALERHLSSGHTRNTSAMPDPLRTLCGLDIDSTATRKTEDRVKSLQDRAREGVRCNLLTANALLPFEGESTKEGWHTIQRRFSAREGFDILIANPPWGAEIDSYKDRLSTEEFSLYRGQVDTWDLFVELSISIVRPGGFIGFIIPDSLFARERDSLRRLLLDTTQIRFIGRFGEKIFPAVSRGCAVLICRRGRADESTTVDCLRLSPALRKKVIRGESTFRHADDRLTHKIPQSRFAGNRGFTFDIYTRMDESEILESLNSGKESFRDYLDSARGVELSKHGKVCRCHNCNRWLPYPSLQTPRCVHCREELVLDRAEQARIIHGEPKHGSSPIIVGEDVGRYLIKRRNWISLDKDGINYKGPSIYKSPKIVIRKTGVGLLASIDYEDSMANQVVYLLRLRPRTEALPLEFFLGLLNSRALYYYLVKTSGETEWRSHPYLTQAQILDLPLPDVPLKSKKVRAAASEISDLVASCLSAGRPLKPEADARIEHLVAKLYGLSDQHYRCIYDTLGEVEQLLPIRCLSIISIVDIFG